MKLSKFALLILISFNIFSNYAQVSWSVAGPGGGGWLRAITITNDAQHTVYVGCDVGGIYKSTDNGQTWEIKDNGLTNYYSHDIAYDPNSPDTLYIANRGGVFKTVDGGEHWVSKRNGFPPVDDYVLTASISDIEIDPNDSSVIYAGVGVPETGYNLSSFHWQSLVEKGTIYKSTDYGENWTRIYNTGIDTTAMIYSIAVDPSNAAIVYAATSKGVYKSVDAGGNWTLRNSGLPHQLAMKLLINPTNTQILYVTMWSEPGNTTWQGGVYKSTNGGTSWTEINTGLPQETGNVSGLTCNYPDLVMDKNNPDILYVGNIPWTPDPGVYKTINGGANWEWVSRPESPNQNMDIGWITEHSISGSCIGIDPVDSNNLFFGSSTHLFKTTDAGTSWTSAYTHRTPNGYWQGAGFETTVVDAIAVDPNSSSNVYVGYWDIGFLKSIDGGFSFKKATEGMFYDANTFDIIVDPDNSDIIYATGGWWEENKGSVYKSNDKAATWTAINIGLPDAQVWSIAIDKNTPISARTLYAASYENGIYKSTNSGTSWTAINNGLGVSGNLQVRKIYVDPNDSNILYAGIEAKQIENGGNNSTIQGGLFKSVNAGASWSRIDSTLPQISVWDIVVVPGNSQIIYTAVSNDYDHTLGQDFDGGVYKSTDGGNTWAVASSGMGNGYNLEVTSINISPTDVNILYATTSDAPYHDVCNGRGIFKSVDAGATWQSINDGLGVQYYDSFCIDPSNPRIIFAGSNGNGLYKGYDADIVAGIRNNSNEDLHLKIENFPNPAKDETTIRFYLPYQTTISMKLYNIQGELVDILLENKQFEKGIHNIWQNLSDKNLSSGLYYYKLTTQSGFVVAKMILSK